MNMNQYPKPASITIPVDLTMKWPANMNSVVTQPHFAKNIAIEDSGAHFTSDNVEDALTELFQLVTQPNFAKNIAIEDSGAHFTSDNVEDALNELFQSVSDGKNQLETAITGKGGTVSKDGSVATFDELDDGIRSIPVGDYSIGETIRDSVLRLLPDGDGMGVEIWSKTDVAHGQGIAVDSAGNVYVAHSVSSGKAVRKLDGNIYFQIVG